MASFTKLLLTAITLLAIANASLFSTMRIIREPEGKAYYRGTTTDILAFRELFQVWGYFTGSHLFWKAMIQNLQIDVMNAESNCVVEVQAYLDLYRDL